MRSHTPRVSVGLPVYNSEKYIDQAIESILSQTFTNFELIISDNASTDRTQSICLTYASKDSRIRYSRNESNLGAAPNFNRVFALSEGEYFKWAPYDDLIEPDFLTRCVETLDHNPSAILCYSKAKVINQNGERLFDYEFGADTSSSRPHERFRNVILRPEYVLQLMGLIRARTLKQTLLHGSFPSSDIVLLAELALQGRFIEIPDRLYLYRMHPEQSTEVMRIERDRVLWFDTSLVGKIVLPKHLFLSTSLKIIRNAPLNAYERAFCYLVMVRWLLVPAHLRALGKDMLLAMRRLLLRRFEGPKVATPPAI